VVWLGVLGVTGIAVGAAVAQTPSLVARAGDQTVCLIWRTPNADATGGHLVYRQAPASAAPVRLTPKPVPDGRFVDFSAPNDLEVRYFVRPIAADGAEGPASDPVQVVPRAFVTEDEFLEFLQATAFDYFWHESNPANGLVRDRSTAASPCSIAAVGFALTAYGIGVDHGWITRQQAADRTLKTLETFARGPQGPDPRGRIGHQGWFYHFLDLRTAERVWNCELSSIDTALLLAGVLYARAFFDGQIPAEQRIRELSTELFDGVNWSWMTGGGSSLTMGWHPESGFIRSRWIGYNEAMILYLMGLGANRDSLPPAQWDAWVSGYSWSTNYGRAFVPFPPLFGHQYSHCWVDFRGIADGFMRGRGLTYFENSRRATLAQQAYAAANPGRFKGYSAALWGLTACDGPGRAPYRGYSARGAPPAENDDGTLAPTAVGGSVPFAPEICLPALRHLFERFREQLWTVYGFRDAFNLQADWFGPDVIGIDQGPILIMIENYRFGRVWQRFMRIAEIRRGLAAAGFSRFDTGRAEVQDQTRAAAVAPPGSSSVPSPPAASADVANRDARGPVEIEVAGDVVCLLEVLQQQYQVPLAAGHEHLYGFRTSGDTLFTLARTKFSEALFQDPRVRARRLLLKGRVFPGTHVFEPQVLRSVREGAVWDLYYYCDVCAIESVAPGLCECCQAPVELREEPSRQERPKAPSR
jgi:hypothetical protein